jgi:hypothetical protein
MAEMGTSAAILGLIGKGLLAADTAVSQRSSGCAEHWFIGSKLGYAGWHRYPNVVNITPNTRTKIKWDAKNLGDF